MATIFYVIIERPFNNLTTMIVFNIATITNKTLPSTGNNDGDERIDNRNEANGKKKFSSPNHHGHNVVVVGDEMNENCQSQHVASTSSTTTTTSINHSSLSLSHQMIKIEIQDLKLSLPQQIVVIVVVAVI
ncbi:hypothetical protein BLA29_011745 [Euroglyphus maynei]|uniref:Uncharacterized protein n=1 Tax=Euroglyphus maynei TaxID=6958 RepID=A0A1Y3BDD4_EURMA|nr:hypothetical protein BLA29_011745 [Euroglyphus maynei]